MTFKEKVRKVQPEKLSDVQKGGVYGCPGHYSYLNVPNYRLGTSCIGDCYKCWNREYVDIVHAEWGKIGYTKKIDDFGEVYRVKTPSFICTNCRRAHTQPSNYCPNCGAKMDVEE